MVARQDGRTDSLDAQVGDDGRLFVHIVRRAMDVMRVAGRRTLCSGIPSRRLTGSRGVADYARECGDAGALRARDTALGKFQSWIRCGGSSSGACEPVVQFAAADAGISLSDSDAHCTRALPARETARGLVTAGLVSHLDQYARLMDYRGGCDCALHRVRPRRFSNGKPGSAALDQVGAPA